MYTKEAIERVRSRFDKWALDSLDLAALQTLGLVDVESEDERIRRELLEYAKGQVRSYNNMVSGDYDSRDKEDKKMHEWWKKIVTYLERQKEQNHSLNFDIISSWLRDHARNYVNGEYNEFHRCVDYDGTIDTERLIADLKVAVDSDTFDVHEQKNQKPVEWSEEDKKILNAAIEMVKNGNISFAFENNKYKVSDWLVSLPGRFDLQPKQEWSKKDEEMKSNVIRTLQYMLENHTLDEELKKMIKDEINWLKSLSERFNIQSNQERSEKDEEMKSNVIRTLQYMLV